MINYFLSVIAYILMPIIGVFLNAPVWIFKNIKKQGFKKSFSNYFIGQALEVDVFANYHFRTLWNTILKDKNGYNFGEKNETISSALGKNQRDKTLSFLGWFLNFILWILDVKYWFKGGHSLNNIDKYKNNYTNGFYTR